MSGFGLNECIYYFTLIHPVYYHNILCFQIHFPSVDTIHLTGCNSLLMTYKHIRNENNAKNSTKLPAKSFLKFIRLFFN